MSNFKYYDYGKLLSYNASYNFLCGGRGEGKTYGAKVRAVKNGIKTGNQFIYMRRYKEELMIAMNTFFADIEHLFPNIDFRVHGKMAQFAPIETREDKKRVWNIIGYFIPLSTAQNQKSVAFPRVTTIIFDEFIIEKGAIHYLPNEATVFNNFFSTVDRYKDKTKVFFLANAVTIMNPYFMEYGIEPDPNKEFIKKADGFIVAHFPDSKEFRNQIYETKFGKFIQGTNYADYAVENKFEDNKTAMVGGKGAKEKYLFTIETDKGSFSVWFNFFNNEYYIQNKLPKVQEIYTLVAEKMDKDKQLLTFSDLPLQRLRTAFRQGMIWFDKPATRNTFAEVFKR